MKMVTRFAMALILMLMAQPFSAQEEPRRQSMWLAHPRPSEGQPVGYAQFQNMCYECHGDGLGKVGTQALEVKYNGAFPALLELRTDLTADIVRFFLRHGAAAMPSIRVTELSDDDMDAIADYLSRSRASMDVAMIFDRLFVDENFDKEALAKSEAQGIVMTEEQTTGRTLFAKGCLRCHRDGGYATVVLERRLRDLNAAFESLPEEAKAVSEDAPRLTQDSALIYDRNNLAPDYILCVVRSGVRNMPPFGPLEIKDAELDLISYYLTRNNPEPITPVTRGPDCQPVIQ